MLTAQEVRFAARSTTVSAAAVPSRGRRAYHVVSGRVLSVTAGAIAATAVALLVGWPGRPPLTDTAAVAAAVASAVVAVLLILGIAAAARRPAGAWPPARNPDLRRT